MTIISFIAVISGTTEGKSRRNGKTHTCAQTDLVAVEGWGSLPARPPSSEGPPCASSSGAASSSSFCPARLPS